MSKVTLEFKNKRKADAIIEMEDDKYTVKKGSKVAKGDFAKAVSNTNRMKFNELKSKGIIDENDTFTEDYTFDSARACGVLLAKADTTTGKTFKVKGTSETYNSWKKRQKKSKEDKETINELESKKEEKDVMNKIQNLEQDVNKMKQENQKRDQKISVLEDIMKKMKNFIKKFF